MKTRIVNTSGDVRYFGFLPPHGKSLAADEEVVLDGDLRTVLATGRGRYSRKTELAQLDSEIDAGNIFLDDQPGNEGSSSL